MLHVGAAKGSAVSVAVCAARRVCVSAHVPLWDPGSVLLLAGPGNETAAGTSISQGQRHQGLQVPWAGLQLVRELIES